MSKRKLYGSIFFGGCLLLVLLASPLVGVLLKGGSVLPYLQFPPQTIEVEQPAFSWPMFAGILLFIIITTWPFWKRLMNGKWAWGNLQNHGNFPWWGWLAVTGTICFWILAWTRFAWLEPFQRYTFFPLWLCFVITLNALTQRISGKCLMTRFPTFFTLLFPLSAVFWWIFEYLNRFVNNWHYMAVNELDAWQYFWEATLPFSTVLPAVVSMYELILQIPVFKKDFANFPSTPWLTSRPLWIVLGLMSILGLIGTGWTPEFMFPLLWIAPGILWVSFQTGRGYINPVLKDISKGDLTGVWASAVSALLCGFFWEMWNFLSAAKWQYNIPGIERFYLFEMPALGYAGYLPFGVICLLVSYSLFSTLHPRKRIAGNDGRLTYEDDFNEQEL